MCCFYDVISHRKSVFKYGSVSVVSVCLSELCYLRLIASQLNEWLGLDMLKLNAVVD